MAKGECAGCPETRELALQSTEVLTSLEFRNEPKDSQ